MKGEGRSVKVSWRYNEKPFEKSLLCLFAVLLDASKRGVSPNKYTYVTESNLVCTDLQYGRASTG